MSRRRIPRVFRSKSKCRGRDRSDLVFRGASERKSAVLWPKLNERGSSLSHPAGFYSIRDATAEIADTPCGSSPTSLRTRRRLWKLFYRPRGGGNGKRHEDEKRERTDGDRDQDRGRERERGSIRKRGRNRGEGEKGRMEEDGWCSIMGNENQEPPGGSELKWLSHATGGCALPAENLNERRRHEKNPFLPSDPTLLFLLLPHFFPSLPYLPLFPSPSFLLPFFLLPPRRYAFSTSPSFSFLLFLVCCLP